MNAFDYVDVEYAGDTHHPEQSRTLSEAVLDTIERFRGEELVAADYVLFNSINPAALDNLFYHDAQSDVVLEFDVDEVRVYLWGGTAASRSGSPNRYRTSSRDVLTATLRRASTASNPRLGGTRERKERGCVRGTLKASGAPPHLTLPENSTEE